MKPSTTANLALILAVAGWLVYGYGSVRLMGEFSPAVPRAYVDAFRLNAMRVLYAGLFTLFVSLVLSICVFKIAPWRSKITLTIVLVPLTFLAFIYFRYG
jgi:hypothetical protein